MELENIFEKYIKLRESLLKSKIYKIVSPKTDKVYAGSTWRILKHRLSRHETSYKYWLKKGKKYCSSSKILELDNYKIKLIENYPCKTKNELRLREGYHIKNHNCVNQVIPGRTDKEYQRDNKEELAQKKEKCYLDNREEFLQKSNGS